MNPLVIGITALGPLTVLAIATWAWARGRVRTPRPLDLTRIQLYRVGTDDRSVGIVTGDIRRVRCAEAWVNSENTAMQMARIDEFSISAIIRYEGARRDPAGRVTDDCVADELADRIAGQHQVPAGAAVVTGSGELRRNRVRHIVHVAAVQGEPGAGFRQIREVGRCVTNALSAIDRITERPAVSSVLFPLLGTGQGGGRLRPTVDALLGATIDYFAMVPSTHVTKVFFLAYTDLELHACEAAFRAIGLSPITGPNPPTPADVPDSSNVDAAPAHLPGGKRLQMGFVIDVVGFGRRSAPEQEAVQSRLSALAKRALADAGVDLDTVDHQWTGDALAAALPTDIDPALVLSDLIRATRVRLADDNKIYRDRIRLRMAMGVGLVGHGATGFAGSMIIEVNRLVDSAPLRTAVRDHPDSDLALLISDHLHAHVVRPGYLQLPATTFCRVDVVIKEFHEPAWLWIAPAV